MREGFVSKMRIGTREVMGCIDICSAAGLELPAGTSLSMVIKRAIVIAVETLRQCGAIPDRDGFEYEEMTSRFVKQPMALKVRTGTSISLSDIVKETMDQPRPTLQMPAVANNTGRTATCPAWTEQDERLKIKMARLMRRFEELKFRKENGGAGNWTDTDEQQFLQVQRDISSLQYERL